MVRGTEVDRLLVAFDHLLQTLSFAVLLVVTSGVNDGQIVQYLQVELKVVAQAQVQSLLRVRYGLFQVRLIRSPKAFTAVAYGNRDAAENIRIFID